ncbi:MAG TPA: ABC-type transport auxiliary lipoprotein family protein [Povalibacter sp.]
MSERAAGDGLRTTARTDAVRVQGWCRAMLVAAVSMITAACGSSLLDSDLPASTRYIIKPPQGPATATASLASQADLSIGRPDVAPGLDTERIAVVRGHELDYYRGALWGGSVTETVQTFLVAAFQDQKLFRSVASEQARITADYMLDIEVRDFQAEYASATEAPNVRVTLVCRLIRVRDRGMVDTIHTTASRPATENRMNAVAVAFEAAMQQVALELSDKTAQLIAGDREKT